MINVITVHWKQPEWVDLQLEYLERNIDGPYRVWTFMHGIDPAYGERFHYARDPDIKAHAVKLNLLAEIASQGAADDDILLFLDSDALVINPLDDYLAKGLAEAPLIAVRRAENNGDLQPHPCFAATTVGFWREIEGDWRKGFHWKNEYGEELTDVGGNLLDILDRKGIEWKPLLRSNIHNPHPLMIGVYDDIVYHHGAGSYPTQGGPVIVRQLDLRAAELAKRPDARLIKLLPRKKKLWWIRKQHPEQRMRRATRDRATETSGIAYAEIERDREFYRALIEPGYDSPLSRISPSPIPEKWLP